MNEKLTNKHIELLFEATELHLKWYGIYYEHPPKFDILLELNHTKLNYLIDDNSTEAEITERLLKMKHLYQTLIDDYSPKTENYEE